MIPTAASIQVHTMTGTWLSGEVRIVDREIGGNVSCGYLQVISGPISTSRIMALRRKISKIKVLDTIVSYLFPLQHEWGLSNIQATDEEDPRKKCLLGFGDRQGPHDSHGHDQKNKIGEDVRDLQAIVEFGWVKTGSFNRLVPELFGGNAQKSAGNVNTHNPKSDKSEHDVHGNCHVSDCKESLVQRQN